MEMPQLGIISATRRETERFRGSHNPSRTGLTNLLSLTIQKVPSRSGFECNRKRNYAYRNYRRNYGVIVTLLICRMRN
eukprot:COSAG01_NODE_12776_length_1691_cov_33.810453_1_plen_77_part_10